MTEASAPVLDYEVSTTRSDDIPRIAFRLNGQIFWVRRPKTALATHMISLMESEMGSGEFGVNMTNVLNAFLGYIELENGIEPKTHGGQPNVWVNEAGETMQLAGKLRGRARLLQRINDPTDEFDLPHLARPMRAVMEAMFENRPTGPSAASSGRRQKTSRSSAARTRSTRAKTSGS